MPITLALAVDRTNEDGSIAYIKDSTTWGAVDYPERSDVALIQWADRYQLNSTEAGIYQYNNPLSAADAQLEIPGDGLMRIKAVAYNILPSPNTGGLAEVNKYYYDAFSGDVIQITAAIELEDELGPTGIFEYVTRTITDKDELFTSGIASQDIYKEFVYFAKKARAETLVAWSQESDYERQDVLLDLTNNISAMLDAICTSMQLEQYAYVRKDFYSLELLRSKL
jgi:hypothetical protein